jgi:hypothetical protein
MLETMNYLKIKVIGRIMSRRENSKRRKRNALPMLLMELILEKPSWSKKNVSGSSLSSSKVNILS